MKTLGNCNRLDALYWLLVIDLTLTAGTFCLLLEFLRVSP